MGKKKSPSYRLIVSEKTKDPHGKSLEILGHYNPVADPKVLELKKDRIAYWLSKGAQASETVHNILVGAGVVSGEKRSVISITKKRQGKMDQKKTDAEEAAKQAAEAEAATAAKEDAAPNTEDTKETPASEETPAEEKKEPAEASTDEEPKTDAPEAPAEEKKEE